MAEETLSLTRHVAGTTLALSPSLIIITILTVYAPGSLLVMMLTMCALLTVRLLVD